MKLAVVDPEVEECITLFTRLKSSLPRPNSPRDSFLAEWALFKRRAASIAANCINKLLPGLIEAIYYIELSDSHVGRDIDLLIALRDDIKSIDMEEVEETIESLLTKLVELAGLNFHAYTSSPNLFEIHTIERGVYGSKTRLYYAIQLINGDSRI